MAKRYARIYNPDWEYWKEKYPDAYAKYVTRYAYPVGTIPTPEQRPVPEAYYMWPRWYAMGGRPSEEEFYSFFLWPDDGSGKQRMGTFPGQPYPPGSELGVSEKVTLPVSATPAEEKEAKEFYAGVPVARAERPVEPGSIGAVEAKKKVGAPPLSAPGGALPGVDQNILILVGGALLALIVIGRRKKEV